jgi:tape measure domain-containing protein
MSHIDERIVKMSFDNRDFEKGISQTLQSLEKLNEVLKNTSNVEVYSNLSKSLKDIKGQLSTLNIDELNKVDKTDSIWTKFGNTLSTVGRGIAGFIGNIDIGGVLDKLGFSFSEATYESDDLGRSVETVTNKFSALGIMAATVLANIANRATNAGMAFLKSFTLDPLMSAFGEYELKMDSIQTILTNTAKYGTSLEDVNKALNELNEYADKTIYNFAEMTDNISKATAAGLTLEDAVTFVKGMANAAAAFGVDAVRMSGATYQMTQALSAGVIKLQDWNSLVQAGMGGEMMQEVFYEAAEGMGIFVDRSIPFRESLASGWLTAEVFMAGMQKLAEDPSLMEAATNVTTFTKLLGTLKETIGSGWAQSFEHIFGNKEQSTEMWTNISNKLSDIINKSAEARNKVLEFWSANGGRDAIISGLANVFTSLGKVLGSVKDAFQDVFPPMTGEKLVEISKKFKEFTEKIKITDEAAKKIKDVFKGVFTVFSTVTDAVGKLLSSFSPLGDVLGSVFNVVLNVASGLGRMVTNIGQAIQKANIFDSIASGIKTVCGWLSTAINSLGDAFSGFSDKLGKLDFSKPFEAIGKVFTWFGTILKPVADGIGKALESINFDSILKVLNTLGIIKIVKTIGKAFSDLGSIGESAKSVFDSLKDVGSSVKDILDSAKDALQAWQQDIQANTLLKIAAAVGILTVSLLALASIDGKSLAKSLTGLGVVFAELTLAYAAMSKIGGIKGALGTSTSLIALASAMLILSGALKVLSTIDPGEMITGLVGLAAALGTMILAVKMMDGSHKGLLKTSTSLVIFGAAMMVMAGALKLLGSIDAETLGGGLFALAAVLVELGAFLAVAKFGSLGPSTVTGILVLSAALLVLSQAVKLFGNLNQDQIVKGLAGIAGILTEIAVFSKFSGGGLNMIGIGAGLAAISGALLVMSQALQSLGSIQWDEMARGLTAMAGGLLVLGVASALISGGKMMLLGVGIGIMSAALLVLGAALKSMGSMSWEEIGKGLLALAGSLTILAVAMYAMSGAIVGAAAMVIMAGALALLTPQLLLLGQMSLSGVGIMLLALAGAFTVLGVAGLLLTPVVPTLLGLAAAIALLGVGCIACGVGLTAVGTGLGLIGAAVGGSGLLIVEFLRQLIKLLPEIGTKAVEAFANFAKGLTTAIPEITAGAVAMISAFLAAIGTLIPEIVNTALDIVVAFVKGLSTAIPQLVTAGMELVVGVLEGIAANIYQLVDAGLKCIINFLDGIAANIGQVIESGINLALSFIEGIADGLEKNKSRLENAVRRVITALINAGMAVIRGAISGFVSGGKDLMNGLVKGIKSMLSAAGSAVKSCVNSAVKAASGLGSKLVSAGKSLIEGFVSGIKSMVQTVCNVVKSVVDSAITTAKNALKINSPSKVFIEIGKYTSMGLAVGMEKYGYQAAAVAGDVANAVIDNVRNPLSNVAKLMDGDLNIDPVITPVMDLSNIHAGTRALNGMMKDGTMQINGVSGKLAGTIGTIQNGNNNSDIISALKDLKDNLNNSGPSYTINGITYDDGSNVVNAVETLVRAARIERRI